MDINKNIVYKKTLTRDFSLVWLQMWYECEATYPKPWNNKYNKSFPYIIFVRNDDTIKSYYDPKGLHWQRWTCLAEIKRNDKFQYEIVNHVQQNLKPIIELINKQILTNRKDLLYLFKLFKQGYPWFLAMWDATSDDNLTGKIDVSAIRKYRETINSFNDDLDNTINQSVKVLFPQIADFTHVITISEIESGVIPSISVLQKRDQGFIYTDKQLFDYQELTNLEKKYNINLEKEKRFEQTEFTGDIACKGYASGKVRRIMGLRNISDFEEGEILVTPMTMPDFLPAMKKSAAIITDEGGVICHAAILARELNKPCIVGTKIATSCLKTGDIVDVDANHGVIKVKKM
jgi:phosphoenolpyruvate synthase/pyruvate phosphate dikinase